MTLVKKPAFARGCISPEKWYAFPMTPLFHPSLVNDPFGDPALYVDFLFERRALLFDLGNLAPLPPRKLLRVSHAFVSHTHVDHFIGFDGLLRLCLGREKTLALFGPPGFVDQVEHRLAAYTWNLVESYPTDFTVVAHEVHPEGTGRRAAFRCRARFTREGEQTFAAPGLLLLNEETFRVRCTFLDHQLPCLAFALEEKTHVNVMKNRLVERGLTVGPWLRELTRLVLRGAPDDTPVQAAGQVEGGERERSIPLGELRQEVLTVVPGQKIAYVTDARYTPENEARIVELARGADYFFIEATFAAADTERAATRCHLTTRQAGSLAREAGAGRVIPFHFSPRYQGEEERLRAEVATAFAGMTR